MANCITTIRILLSVGLLFCPALSPSFYVLYLTASLSDMIDGPVARKTHTATAFGAKLDTIADLIFVAACLYKLLPALRVPTWLYIWTAAIALIKLSNIVSGYIKQKRFVSIHSRLNRVTGALLFLLPLSLSSIDFRYTSLLVCLIATFAALWEGALVRACGSKQQPQS